MERLLPTGQPVSATPSAAGQETVVLPETRTGSVVLGAAPLAEFCSGDPPTTEPEILATIVATRQRLEKDALDTDTATSLIAELAQFLTDAPGAVVELLERNELVYRGTAGTAAKSIGLRVDTQNSMSGLCFMSREVMRCDDTEKDIRVDKAACRWVGIRSMVLVPFVRDGRSIGVLAVISPLARAFGDRDVWTLQRVTEQLSEMLARHVN
jgi:putative methionine-R-sulfoxide reductase with GAF domain